MYVSKTDKILFHIFIGVILGLGIHFSFPYMRGIFAPILMNVFLFGFNPETGISDFLGFMFNLSHAVISALIPSLLAALIILKAQKKTLVYCLLPSITILAMNIKDIFTFEISLFTESPYYAPQILNPFIIILIFVGVFRLLSKIKLPNKAFKPTPESGAV